MSATEIDKSLLEAPSKSVTISPEFLGSSTSMPTMSKKGSSVVKSPSQKA
jgi:hypothetical protein